MNGLRERGEWAAGWRTVVCAALGVYTANVVIYSVGAVMVPLQRQFGWGRQDISFGLLIVSLMAIFLSPLVGLAVDRFGARKVVIPGIVVLCSALGLLSTAGPTIQGWWALWIIVGVGFNMMTSGVWVPGVVSHFTKRRGLAISLCIAGAGLSAITTPYIMTVLTEAYGWKFAYQALAALCFVVVFPMTLFWFTDARVQVNDRVQTSARASSGLDIGQVIRLRQYWQLSLASALTTFGLIGLIVHFVPILTDAGIGARDAAETAGLAGIGSIVGRLATGYCLDRVHGSIVGSIALALPIGVCILLLGAGQFDVGNSRILLSVSAFVLGLGLGSENDVLAYLTSRYVGLRNYGFAYGSLTGFMSVGAGVGPWLGGAIFDRQHSYESFEILLCGTFSLAILMVSTLGRYPDASNSAYNQIKPRPNRKGAMIESVQMEPELTAVSNRRS